MQDFFKMGFLGLCLIATTYLTVINTLKYLPSGDPQVDRFKLMQLGSFRSDQFLLDTATGAMFQIVQDKDKGILLQPVRAQKVVDQPPILSIKEVIEKD